MSKLVWDAATQRFYTTGVDHGVLYPSVSGLYPLGVAWNGLTTVTESPSGAESTKTYADNIQYLNLISAEVFNGTIEAYTFPPEFEPCDGMASPEDGITIGQQPRQAFGFCYRTIKGNDTEGNQYGEVVHLIYNALAAPSEKANATVNDSPAAVTFSWGISTTPIAVDGYAPTSTISIDSTRVDASAYQDLLDMLYGTDSTDPTLPMPNEVLALFAGTVVAATPTAPTYVNGTHTLTIPSVTGLKYYNHGVLQTAGDHVVTESPFVEARLDPGYKFTPGYDTDWSFVYS